MGAHAQAAELHHLRIHGQRRTLSEISLMLRVPSLSCLDEKDELLRKRNLAAHRLMLAPTDNDLSRT